MYLKFKSDVLWRSKNERLHNFLRSGLIRDTARGNCWLAGGAFRSMFDKTDVLVDFDLFFSNELRKAEVALDLEDMGYKCVFKCPLGELTTYVKQVNTDLEDCINHGPDLMKVQLISKTYYRCMEHLLDTFDLDACRFAYDGETFITTRRSIRSVKTKNITLNSIEYPNATFKRLLKYRDKGYKITNDCIESFTKSVWDKGFNRIELNGQFYVD